MQADNAQQKVGYEYWVLQSDSLLPAWWQKQKSSNHPTEMTYIYFNLSLHKSRIPNCKVIYQIDESPELIDDRTLQTARTYGVLVALCAPQLRGGEPFPSSPRPATAWHPASSPLAKITKKRYKPHHSGKHNSSKIYHSHNIASRTRVTNFPSTSTITAICAPLRTTPKAPVVRCTQPNSEAGCSRWPKTTEGRKGKTHHACPHDINKYKNSCRNNKYRSYHSSDNNEIAFIVPDNWSTHVAHHTTVKPQAPPRR